LKPTMKGGPVAGSGEAKPGMVLDYDAEGDLVSVEILAASERITEPQGIEFQMAKG